MIVAGCDVGSMTAKAVIMKEGVIAGTSVLRCGPVAEKSALSAMQAALDTAGLTMNDVNYCVGTGYGKKMISFGQAVESEISCHARGAVWQVPDLRMLVDIGGQDAKAVRFDEKGNVVRYTYNDKCASGTGRFLEIIAEALDIPLDELGELSKKALESLRLSNQCVVFAETEILSLVNEGKDLPSIIKAMHHAVANRAAAMAKSIGLEGCVGMTGGVARNAGMFEALGEALGLNLVQVPQPQINGAIGAALFAADAAGKPMV